MNVPSLSSGCEIAPFLFATWPAAGGVTTMASLRLKEHEVARRSDLLSVSFTHTRETDLQTLLFFEAQNDRMMRM
jgi:hypothetical protein